MSEKLEIIRDLIRIEMPDESREYLRKHMTWTLEELKTYREQVHPA